MPAMHSEEKKAKKEKKDKKAKTPTPAVGCAIGPAGLPPAAKDGKKAAAAIGPAGPPTSAASQKGTIGPAAPSTLQTDKAKRVVGPAGPPTAATQAMVGVRRSVIGPARPLPDTPVAAAVAAASSAAAAAEGPTEEVVDKAAVANCRAGEMPRAGWTTAWNSVTKRAALVAAIESAHMHLVYCLCPHSSAFKEDVGMPKLEQQELDRLLLGHGCFKFTSKKAAVKEAVAWLLEEGACLEAMCGSTDFKARSAAADILVGLGAEEAASRAATMLRNDDWQVRQTAAEAMGQLAADAVKPQKCWASLEQSRQSMRGCWLVYWRIVTGRCRQPQRMLCNAWVMQQLPTSPPC
eukprot:TRINITY_DN17880_c0_g1_i2.p1 TRINITY_DN17880_c0_g1~~TRINITY_DN17880_c0_g1_i2.p1  ORF type:complete len:363 (+),score=90.79 TRINITY_DN17880_c0_g1_i2:44-1090(+)